MICPYCDKPVILQPSAAERARKFGGTAADYTALFPAHAECILAKRDSDTRELMARIAADTAARKVVLS